MSKGTRLVSPTVPKPMSTKQTRMAQKQMDALIQHMAAKHQHTYFTTTNSTTSSYIPANASVSGVSGAQRGIKILDERGDTVFEITSRGDLFFYIDDHEKIVNSLEHLWKKQVKPLIVTQAEIDALAYAAGIYIKEPKNIDAIREKAWDRLEQLALGGNIIFEEDENPHIRRNI